MEVDESTRLILLPENSSSFDIISLSFGDVQTKLLASDDQLYEVREINGSSEYDVRPEPKLPTGGAVKSVILESKDGLGAVLKSAAILTSTPFNVVYYVLSRMYQQKDVYTSRYQTLEDILDSFSLLFHKTLTSKIEEAVEILCTSIEENGDRFYKLSLEKSFEFLSTKINSLKLFLLASPELVLSGMIKDSMVVGSEEPPTDLLELQTLRYSVDLVFGSYMTDKLKTDYLSYSKIDYLPLEAYFKEQESKKRALAAIRDNMESVVLSTKNANKGTKNIKAKASKPTKVTKKVAVGKGALDSFFKRS